MIATNDLTNQVFGKLTVLHMHPEKSFDGRVQWYCKCSCSENSFRIIIGKSLTSGNSKTCGCTRIASIKESNSSHGMSNSKEYRIWKAIKERCYYEKHKAYGDYGGRGITVSDDWINSFENFYRDMGPRPSDDHSIERRDGDKNYSKNNCYWATRTEQNNNTRRNIFFTRNGVSKTLAAWCKELNLSYNKIYMRMNAYGWSFNKAIGDE